MKNKFCEICVSSDKKRDISQLMKMVNRKISVPLYKQRHISQLMKNGELRDFCFFILTERNFAVHKK